MHDGATQVSDTRVAETEWIAKSVPEIAALIGIGNRLAWHLVHTGQLASFKIGAKRLVRRVDLDAYLADLVEQERELAGRLTAVA